MAAIAGSGLAKAEIGTTSYQDPISLRAAAELLCYVAGDANELRVAV